jgi:hypothetical protein
MTSTGRPDAYRVARRDPRLVARSQWGPTKERQAQEILDAIRRWAGMYGLAPTMADWEPSRARRQNQERRAERWEAGGWPSVRIVRSHFGTMSSAIRAAGLPARESPSRARPHVRSAEAVLDAIRAWNERYGEPPGMADWAPTRARRAGQQWRVARFYEGDWPSIATVRSHFGTLNNAIATAGLRPRAPGQRARSRHPPDHSSATINPDRHRQLLTLRVRSVGNAARRDDPDLLIESLNDLAVAALTWADEMRAAAQLKPARDSAAFRGRFVKATTPASE